MHAAASITSSVALKVRLTQLTVTAPSIADWLDKASISPLHHLTSVAIDKHLSPWLDGMRYMAHSNRGGDSGEV